MKTLAMFPGQGSQYVGMGKSILQEFPYTKEVFEEAEDAAKLSIRKLCFEGPESDLQMTANTQPAILTTSVATWKILQQECGFSSEYFAGHSLGEYSALVASGRLALGRAALLVRKRGEAMQEAVPQGVGAMAAVMKVSAEDLEALCAEMSREGSIVEVVNYNSPQQLVVAGHTEAVDRIAKKLTELKKRCVKLAVSAPFHSRLMSPAKDAMKPLLLETEFSSQESEIFANVSGEIVAYKAQHLIDQIDSPVRWTQIMLGAADLGVTRFVEVGPGKVLNGLARRTLPKEVEFFLFDTDDCKEAIQRLA
ncbi:ACP S-malonyltransferase [Pseudobacteriovorax antillogorgiicola]|uniref:Malonyl CoA-acyl carrier protein transacylase n=1 Tax=Pseudobacteriovorax antillogorgiicola TaxID=1513793 RepID=A0A1Y6C7I8_9BACT|nr:ACP S-malonyltransferase [Pseudobacteriovorax antillogorgiicola]TCS49393.1 [acyl-carrier-protein] S-malonyltransferase [Pseudobacteriovorax antillogorgiicola]SMF47161.1 [acyl-carrier-protein] S-malonyltransferase [Pseudobacteriovorax antillogorgiicola]